MRPRRRSIGRDAQHGLVDVEAPDHLGGHRAAERTVDVDVFAPDHVDVARAAGHEGRDGVAPVRHEGQGRICGEPARDLKGRRAAVDHDRVALDDHRRGGCADALLLGGVGQLANRGDAVPRHLVDDDRAAMGPFQEPPALQLRQVTADGRDRDAELLLQQLDVDEEFGPQLLQEAGLPLRRRHLDAAGRPVHRYGNRTSQGTPVV